MLQLLALLTLALTAADHWTTYLCLRNPIDGWIVTEANPLAEWLFESVGLVPGLLLDSAISIAAIGFVLTTGLFTRSVKGACFGLLMLSTGFAVINNVRALEALKLSSLGTF